MRTAAALMIACVAAAAVANAQGSEAVADGPLLCFQVHSEDGRERIHHVLELDRAGAARAFWRSPGNAAVLHRLDRRHVLMASYGDPYALLVVDLASGAAREIAPGVPHSFVAVHGDEVLYIGDDRYGKGDDFLYTVPWPTAGERRRVADVHFDRVPLVRGNLAIGVERSDAAVWVTSLVGGACRRVWVAPGEANRVRVACSPGGQRLAIGCVGTDGSGRLAVVDTGTAAIVRSWQDLPIQVSPCSSDSPTLEVGWRDDLHVICSETRGDALALDGQFVHVTRSVIGDEASESAYSAIGLRHVAPPRPDEVRRPPRFSLTVDGEVTSLRRTIDDRVLARANAAMHAPEHVAVSPDGQYGTSHRSSRCTVFHGEQASPTPLPRGAHGLTWLPASR